MFRNLNHVRSLKSSVGILSCVMLAVLATACGASTGAINGRLIGADSGEPIQEAQIILCLLPEVETADYICTLQAAPTAVTDATGAFALDEVPSGSYILTYGLTDELAPNASEWDGVTVDTKMMRLNNIGQVEEVLDGTFWENGRDTLGEIQIITAADALILLNNGTVKSNRLGIWITAEEGKLTPVVAIQGGETTDLNWQVYQR